MEKVNIDRSKTLAILVARVSDKLQDSNKAQINRLIEYARNQGFKRIQKVRIKESSTKADRKKFQEVIAKVKKSKEPIALFVDTVDRLQRSFKESVVFDDLRKEGKVYLYFHRENLIIHKDSNSADLIRWDMGVMFARSYVLQLSDNVKRSFKQMRLDGIKTGPPPIGYVSVKNDKGKRIDIIPDKNKSALIVDAFNKFSTGNYSVKAMAKEMTKRGLKGNKNNEPLANSMMHKILADPFYYGEMRCIGKLYPHKYKPLISQRLFDDVQDILHGRRKNPSKPLSKEFIFGNGLLKCHKCGCSYSGEEKKGKFIYYSCTNAKGTCKRVYVPEKDLLEPVREIFKKLQLPEEKANEVIRKLKETTEHKSLFQKNELARLRTQYDNLQKKMDRLLDMCSDGLMTREQYEEKIDEAKKEQRKIEDELEAHTNADEDYLMTAGRVIDLSKRALDLFDSKSSEIAEKRQLLGFVLQNPTVDGKKLIFTLRNPFDKVLLLNEHPIKLPRQDSNLRPID